GVALVELRLEARHVTELGGAHRREVLGMGEQNRPFVSHPFVKVDRALGRRGGEIGGLVTNADRHGWSPFQQTGHKLRRGRATARSPGQMLLRPSAASR